MGLKKQGMSVTGVKWNPAPFQTQNFSAFELEALKQPNCKDRTEWTDKV
jgi:hypothetical protein